MAYPSGTKPIQAYKSRAEFKALRLNRTEQCRLKSAQSFITREERNFHKDFRSSRSQVENNFLRRFSVQESAPASPVPWSATPTPRRMSALSSRRVSEIPPASVRRSSVWSLPDSAVRSRLLQQRRQTYGEASARSPLVCRPDTARMPKIPDTDHVAGCDVYARISSGTESCRSCGPGDHRIKQSPEHYHRKDAYQDKSECCGVRHHINNGHDHAEIAGNCSECPDTVRCRTALGRIDETHPSDTHCTTLIKTNRKPRILTANISRSNLNNSRPTTPVTDDLHRHSNRSRSASLVSSSKFNALKIRDPPANRNNWMSGSESEPPETESVKCERKVSILRPPSRHAPMLLQTPAVSDAQLPPNPSEETDVPQRAERCSAEDNTDSFPQAVTFNDFQTDLESDEQTELQDRVASFLQDQSSFNRRFPLEKADTDKFECVKSRVMQYKSGQYGPQKTRSKQKQRMIDEVLEKLGMAKQDGGAGSNFPVL